ncbi:hypothetical protein KIPB_010697, partial [Kipferlia bialata]
SDYPVTQRADVKASLIRRLWFPPNDPSIDDADYTEKIPSLLYYFSGPIVLYVVITSVYTMVTDPTGARRSQKIQDKRRQYRAKYVPTSAVLRKWAKQDKKEARRVKTLDPSGLLTQETDSLGPHKAVLCVCVFSP